MISELDFKRSGYFVEFGATNGVDLSNTWMLEREFGWTGILAEPARVWREALAKNRSCIIDHRCVWTESGKTLNFTEVDNPELSTIDSFKDGDMHGGLRKDSRHYEVPTISLTDLLAAHGAPREIDYLSIDTEGSEYDILSSFDFNSYHIRVITVEHNFTPARDKIRRLLEAHGFVRKLDAVSHVDDWYVNTRH